MHEKFSHYKVNRTFSNLTFLGLIFMVYDWDCFIEVLQHCPKLQTLLIVKYADRNPDDKKWVQRSQPVPKCLTSHLKKFTLKNFRGWECELQFAKYILQNAKVLRSMRICSVAFSNPEAKFELIRKLSLCPRRSETCKLSFE
ncbi:hypothetical protein RIF29_17044 [Crotalaria pallida]|uniref:FBD domain-containing protein n=1 Tax=Crotalaria pallida TaxID=3830 RepID=A0AAN9ICK8_CROPI